MELVIYLECIKKEKPPFRGVFKWRWEAELNRCKRICSPRPNRSAIPPVKWCVVYQKLFAPVNREKLWGSRLWHSQRRGGQGADRAIQKPQRHPVILKTAVGANFSHAEARCARDEVVWLPERSEPEGPQGAARGRDFNLTQSSRSTRSLLEAVSFHYYFADLAYFA